MKVLINGRVLKHKTMTGIEKYTWNLIAALLKDSESQEIDIDIVQPKFSNKYYQHFWEHFLLPFKTKDYDILFCPTGLIPILPIKNTKLVIMIHSLAFLKYPKNYSRRFVFYYTFMTNLVVKRAHHILTPSKTEEQSIIEFYPLIKFKISHIHNGISEKFFFNCEIIKKDYILFVGSLNKLKNFTAVINAFLLLDKSLKIHLKLIVPKSKIFKLDNERKRILKMAEQDERIDFIYNVEKEELIRYYQEAKVFLFPSLYESFGKPPVEAMACGTPVVASNLSAIPEICEDAALYVNPLD